MSFYDMNINFILRNFFLYFCTVLLDVSIKYCIKCSIVFIITDLGIQCGSTVWTHPVKFVMDTGQINKTQKPLWEIKVNCSHYNKLCHFPQN